MRDLENDAVVEMESIMILLVWDCVKLFVPHTNFHNLVVSMARPEVMRNVELG